MITLEDIRSARARVGPYVRRTPTLSASALKEPLDVSRVSLKLECLQVTGSFKARGALNRVLSAPKSELKAGLVTASGGNHGLAIARTAYVTGVPSTIFLPSNVSPAKLEKLKSWGANVEIHGTVFDEANEAARDFARKTSALYVHPFADPLVVAGQGTLALDILEEIADVEVVLVGIGGGGLIAGMATAIKALRPSARIIGVEPEGSPTLHASLKAGHVVTLPEITTIVPTMSCLRTDDAVFDTVRRHVDEIVLVSDEAMRKAARWLWFEMGVAADLSGAASVAALQSGLVTAPATAHVCALICGAGPDGMA